MAVAKKAAPAKKTAAKAPAKKAATAKVVTISSKQLAAKLAEDHELSKKAVEAIMADMTTMIIKHLKKGEKVRLGLGILQVRKRAARMGRNPATGEAIKIKASKKLAFRPAKEVKEAI
jgi:DNA-binding protein HU-beta